MKIQIDFQSKNTFAFYATAFIGIFLAIATTAQADDPRTNCWFTAYSGQYARIYTNNAMESAGTTLTTWSNGSQTQSLPAYCGIQEIYSSSNWIYVRSTGLASYNMGPWYLNSGRTMEFPNLPVNQKVLFRFPRTNSVPTTKSLTGAGQIGIFVDGVEMFNSWDANYWNGTTDVSAGASNGGYWNRDAYVNEGVTFDAGYAHQQQAGTFHYHADPIALRYELGDHVDYDAATKTYYEDTNAPTKHSPILAWTADGFPLYGPYGYSNPTNPASGIRRMISGYVIRNGQYGTSNLTANGRTTIPQWAVRIDGVSSNQSGPNVSSSYPLGRYMEDNDYLGDDINPNTGTNYQQGADYDLDEYNGRWCVTPEFPNGTYAYFVAINSNGVPVFPYDIGRAFYGNPTGGSVSSITEAVVTNFLGGTNLASTLHSPGVNNGTVTLSWSAVEGGSYQVEATTNLADSSGWTVLASDVSPNKINGGYTNVTSLNKRFYRVGRTSVATFDSAGTTLFNAGGYGITSISPTSGARGTTFTLTINLDSSVNPPPDSAPINSVTVGTISGASNTHVSQTQVTSSITIPANATTGAQTVSVVFPGPPDNPQDTMTYSLTNSFTIY